MVWPLAALYLLLLAGLATGLVLLEGVGAVGVLLAVAGLAAALLIALAALRWRTEGLARAISSLARGETAPLPQGPDSLVDALSEAGETLRQARRQSELYRAALEASADAILALDEEGRVRFANAAAATVLERPREELLGRPLAWALPDERALATLRAARQEGRRRSATLERPQRRYLRMTVTPLSRGDWATLVALQELTELKRTEQVRRDFVANVSHELRTPLASLKAAIETLQEGALADPAVAQDFLARAASEVDRLVSLVEELLELSQLEAGVLPLSRRTVDAGELLQRAVERMRPQAERKGLRLLARDAPGLPSLNADAERLERAILNLLDNAIKFTPAGGTVEASVAPCPEGVLITVRDTGPGIEREDLPRIFERFYKADRSRQSGGAGLGLAIARHIVEAHGGRIWADSRPGHGTTFSILLPAGPSPGPSP